MSSRFFLRSLFLLLGFVSLNSCGGGVSDNSSSAQTSQTTSTNPSSQALSSSSISASSVSAASTSRSSATLSSASSNTSSSSTASSLSMQLSSTSVGVSSSRSSSLLSSASSSSMVSSVASSTLAKPTNLSYPSPQVFSAGSAITVLYPTVTGSVSLYSVSPSLPSGLAINSVNGQISGTPSGASSATNYTITAQNTGGSTSFSLNITVNSSPVSSNPCTDSTTIFCETFENGNFQKWDDGDGNPAPDNTIVADTGPHNISGNKVGRLQAKVGTTSGADFTKSFSSSYDKLYLRYFQKFESGFDFTALNHAGGGLFANRNKLGASGVRPSGSDYIWSILQYDKDSFHLYTYYRGMYQDCADPNGACWGDHLPCSSDEGTGSGPSNYCTKAEHRDSVPLVKPQTNKWYCMEVLIDLSDPVQADNLATGQQNIWIDGVAQGPFQHMWFRTTPNLKLDGVWISSYFHNGQTNTAGILYDDIVVSTTRIGCN